jgi:hypothetical protein
MDEMELTEAESNMNDLMLEYAEMDKLNNSNYNDDDDNEA